MFFRKRQFPALGFSYGIALLALAALARAQGPPTATVSFTFDFPGSDPAHYVISANADGSGSYVSSGKAASSSDDASDNSFRVEWVERRYVDDALAATERWSAILTIVVQTPTDADRLKKNPLGVYVHALNWSKELG